MPVPDRLLEHSISVVATPSRRLGRATKTSRTSAQPSRTADVENSSCSGNSTIPRPPGRPRTTRSPRRAPRVPAPAAAVLLRVPHGEASLSVSTSPAAGADAEAGRPRRSEIARGAAIALSAPSRPDRRGSCSRARRRPTRATCGADQLLGLLRSPRPPLVDADRRRVLEHRLEDLPRALDAVLPDEQRVVAAHRLESSSSYASAISVCANASS